jgi:CDP-glucose 4,6-dehydratase
MTYPATPAPGHLPDAAFWRGRRVLVTGDTGFTGAWAAAWLRLLGAEVAGLALPPEPGPSLHRELPPAATARPCLCDIRDPAATLAAVRAAAPELVLHLAAQALVRRSYRAPAETFATNVMGTAHLLDALRQVPGVRAAVIVTSDKCYANRNTGEAFLEDAALGGDDPYSASKAAAELVAASWRHAFPGGARIATARAGNVIGGGDWAEDRLLPDCARAFAAGNPVRLRNPASTRPWQHVLDAIAGYLLLVEALAGDDGASFAEAWNFGPEPGAALPVAALAERAATEWGAGAVIGFDPGPHPPEAALLAVDSRKARARLGWRPRLDGLTAVGWTMDWYRRRHAGQGAGALVAEQLAAFAAHGVPA